MNKNLPMRLSVGHLRMGIKSNRPLWSYRRLSYGRKDPDRFIKGLCVQEVKDRLRKLFEGIYE